MLASNKVISTILKHDSKVISYKIALLRAINDVVLTYPDLRTYQSPVAAPLKLLAKFWIAYYWPFVDSAIPIQQGQQAKRDGKARNDMAFRPALSKLREQWEQTVGGLKNPADGFFLINELKSTRKWQNYLDSLVEALSQAVTAIARTIEMPIRYAGPGQWSIFARPQVYREIPQPVVAVPGTKPSDRSPHHRRSSRRSGIAIRTMAKAQSYFRDAKRSSCDHLFRLGESRFSF